MIVEIVLASGYTRTLTGIDRAEAVRMTKMLNRNENSGLPWHITCDHTKHEMRTTDVLSLVYVDPAMIAVIHLIPEFADEEQMLKAV